MRTRHLLVLTLVALLALAGAALADARNFRAHLSGDEEVPAVDTKAQGQALLRLSQDGSELDYMLIVANIEGVTQAHIHCGAAGVNGPITVFLFGLDPTGVTINGILMQGTITDAEVMPLDDSPECPGGVADFDDLLAKIRSGDAYVNVHTLAFPGGEIRGQLR